MREDDVLITRSVAEGSLKDLHQRMSRELERAGYSIELSENDVIDAEVFFSRGKDAMGGVKFFPTRCDGQVQIHLFIR